MNTEIAVNIKGFIAEPWKKVENIFFLQKSIYTPTTKKATAKIAKLVVLQ